MKRFFFLLTVLLSIPLNKLPWKCLRKICPVCQPIKMAIQGKEGSGIPDHLNLSAHAQTINAQASLANKIELVK